MPAGRLHHDAAATDGATLSLRSYDSATGDYVLELRNETKRSILYLNPYVAFDTIRSPDAEPFLELPEGMVLMVHGTKLVAGGSSLPRLGCLKVCCHARDPPSTPLTEGTQPLGCRSGEPKVVALDAVTLRSGS